MGWVWLLRLISTFGTRFKGRKQSGQLGPCGPVLSKYRRRSFASPASRSARVEAGSSRAWECGVGKEVVGTNVFVKCRLEMSIGKLTPVGPPNVGTYTVGLGGTGLKPRWYLTMYKLVLIQ